MRMLRTLLCSDSSARYSKKHVIIPSLRARWNTLSLTSSLSRQTAQDAPSTHTLAACQACCVLRHSLAGSWKRFVAPRTPGVCSILSVASIFAHTYSLSKQYLPFKGWDGGVGKRLQALLHHFQSPHWNGLLLLKQLRYQGEQLLGNQLPKAVYQASFLCLCISSTGLMHMSLAHKA